MPSLPSRESADEGGVGLGVDDRGIGAGDGAPLVRRDAPLDAHRQPGDQRHVAVAGDQRGVARRAVHEIDDTAGAAGVVEERERWRLVAPEDVGREIADVLPHRAPQPRQRVARDQVRASRQRRPGAERRDRRPRRRGSGARRYRPGARPVSPAPTLRSIATSRTSAIEASSSRMWNRRLRSPRSTGTGSSVENTRTRGRRFIRAAARGTDRGGSAAQRDQVNAAARKRARGTQSRGRGSRR